MKRAAARRVEGPRHGGGTMDRDDAEAQLSTA
ncbi:hypothetical protein GGD83_000522 [Rhodoblastus sphagnicola]|nr:hypothetical protein [Rhodoblastus sphagnicola]